jgi:hypothetical protein
MPAMVLLPTFAVVALIGTCGLASAIDGPLARSARVLNVHDQAHLRYISSSGSLLTDEGQASGTLPGKVRLRFTYDGSPTVSAQLTISGPGWSMRARAQGKLSNPTSPTPSFRGVLTIGNGSGRYAHARGSGELFGVFNRRNYGLTVQAIGKLTY